MEVKDMTPGVNITTTTMPSLAYERTPYERRSKPRISVPFPAKVSGHDADGLAFEVETAVDNISSGGCYLRIMPCVKPGAQVEVVFKLMTSLADANARSVKVKGKVLRVDERPGGVCGVALSFLAKRFI